VFLSDVQIKTLNERFFVTGCLSEMKQAVTSHRTAVKVPLCGGHEVSRFPSIAITLPFGIGF
jgi:hypothetical protein